MTPMREDIRAALGDGPDPARRTRQRARLIAEARGRQGRWFKELAIGALAAALGSAAVYVVWQQRAPAGLEAPKQEGNAFVFNEASQVYLEPGAQAHVVKATGREAIVVLDRGELTVSITSGRKNLWRFRAGENEVVVRGTKFSMLWKPGPEALDVQVSEGKVEVHTSDGQLRFVTAGERLSYTKPKRGEHSDVVQVEEEPAVEVKAQPAKKQPAAPSPPAGERAGVRGDSPAPHDAPLTPTLSPTRGEGAAAPAKAVAVASPQPELRPLVSEWKRHAEAGRYAKAVALVEEQGLGGALDGASGDDIFLFADAARLARRVDLGRKALTSLRERFKGTPDAAEAAFRLGRLEFDAGRFADAGGWFQLYVLESPDGPFIAEAMGRRVDAWKRAADPRAGQAASDYLGRYPKGAYAPLAKQVLESL